MLLRAIGSSPLARGRRSIGWEELVVRGIIPARAGSTAGRLGVRDGLVDHPRSRGVDRMSCPPSSTVNGSSPLARGRPGAPSSSTRAPGIIPARAGSTHTYQRMVSSSADHPRSRGVDKRGGRVPPERPGSSPLARGRRGHGYRGLVEDGIIPARAGSTWAWLPGIGRRWDHPRSRGVDAVMLMAYYSITGSSPLARGRQGARGVQDRLRGIIPARAGSTEPRNPPDPWDRDHPRSRGVDHMSTRVVIEGRGSSPLARGRRAGRGPPW